MTSFPKLDATMAVGDRVCLWVVVLIACGMMSVLAVRADRDPPSLIAPACITIPTKGGAT